MIAVTAITVVVSVYILTMSMRIGWVTLLQNMMIRPLLE